MANLKITMKRGLAGTKPGQRKTMASLGLRKINHSVVHPDNAATRGQIAKVSHLVSVEEVD
ncbi:50S ribosomal protein L30 [Nanchangia anserum]|uniref:Large ribosomal subunit protein uL30 n=1 Tax=Nanchangia anserum TaxID=2692125 RepID=A0A8I0GE45_9ACTO|nr:50S ribosomal protein L30 [Nanchangia anserum]MBD3689187.1 50S ribosomal protein L30 [Nanchangia anserum]QOX81414.1 50S ribosomal protein L30 [Nanchangia anserum]